GRAPLPGAAAAAAADTSRLVPGEPAEAVVTEEHVPEAVVLRASDVGTVGGGREHDRGDPPARGGEGGHTEHDDLDDPAREPRLARDEVREAEWGQDDE